MLFMYFIFYLIPLLMNIAFVTLLERKIMGISQNRLGPNKNSIIGIFQPISDALKLLTKKVMIFSKNEMMMFFIAPLLMIFSCIFLWSLLPNTEMMFFFKFSFIFMLIIISINIFSFIMIAWSSKNKFTSMGCIRAISQVISYEMLMIFLIFYLVVMIMSFNINFLLLFNEYMVINWTFPILFIWFYISFLMETHRAPFDLAESESELVSGFNTEYMAAPFAFIFMAEYGFIIFFSLFLSILFITNFELHASLMMILMVSFFLYTRCVYARLRFDSLMMICWKYLMYSFITLSIMEIVFLMNY